METRKALPEGWRWVELGDICEVKRGKSLTRKEITEGDIPVIAGGQTPAYYHTQANRTGEVITVSGSGAYAGFVNFFDRPIFASDCSTLQIKAENVLMKYVYLAMKSRQPDIYALRMGSAQPHVYAKNVAKIKIPLPPLPEQKRIAAILKDQMAATEKARTAAQARLEAIKALPAAFLRQAFPQPDQPLPEGWRWVKLGDICEVKRGKSLTRKEITEGDIPVIAGGQTPAYYHNQANRTGEVITVSGSGAYAGFVNFFDRPIFASDCSTLQIKAENVLMKYVYLAMKSRQPDIYALRMGSAQPHVYAKNVAKIKIPLPPLPEQKRIAATLKAQMAAVEKARTAGEEELTTINALPAALLRRAFNGEI